MGENKKRQEHIQFHDENNPEELAEYILKIIADELVKETKDKINLYNELNGHRLC